jgi:hypothetical protein
MIFQYFHESTIGNHLGTYKTVRKIRADFLWKGMDKCEKLSGLRCE